MNVSSSSCIKSAVRPRESSPTDSGDEASLLFKDSTGTSHSLSGSMNGLTSSSKGPDGITVRITAESGDDACATHLFWIDKSRRPAGGVRSVAAQGHLRRVTESAHNRHIREYGQHTVLPRRIAPPALPGHGSQTARQQVAMLEGRGLRVYIPATCLSAVTYN